jgi:hypothetical protein
LMMLVSVPFGRTENCFWRMLSSLGIPEAINNFDLDIFTTEGTKFFHRVHKENSVNFVPSLGTLWFF